jgi:hypothetical protein
VAGSIKRELQVRFSTTGDGEVVRSIAKVDDGLKGVGDTSGAAGRSIGDLSESLDKGLENSVGRAFKATDRLNSIVGQVGGAIGLATLAVTAMVAAYEFATKALNKNTAAQKFANSVRNQATREIDAYLAAYAQMPGATDEQVAAHVKEAAAVEAANRHHAEAAALLDAAKRARDGAALAVRSHTESLRHNVRNSVELGIVLTKREAAQKRVEQADIMVTRAAERLAGANRILRASFDEVRERQIRTAQASLVLEKTWARFGASATKAGRGLLNFAAPGLNQVIDAVSNKQALASAEALGVELRGMLGLDFGGGKAPVVKALEQVVETTTQAERRIRNVFAPFQEQMSRVFALRSTDEQFAGFIDGLEGLVPIAKRVGDAIRGALDIDGPDGEPGPVERTSQSLGEFAKLFIEATKGLGEFGQAAALAGIDTLAKGMEGLAHGTADAAAAAFFYGESFGQAMKEAVAALAVQAGAEALFQSAKALAFLAAGLFTGSPAAFKAAATAGASAGAFFAIAGGAGAIGKATGAFDGAGGKGGGSGVPAGPSSRDAGRTGDTGGGAETIIINMGNQRLFATERDVGSALTRSLNAASRGRGRPRIRGAAIGGA